MRLGNILIIVPGGPGEPIVRPKRVTTVREKTILNRGGKGSRGRGRSRGKGRGKGRDNR
jgi:hypothetical protein